MMAALSQLGTKGVLFGAAIYLFVRYGVFGFFIVDQSQRAVKTRLGKAIRRPGAGSSRGTPGSPAMRPDEQSRYAYPIVDVYQPGFYFKWPWEKVHKVSVATVTINMAVDPEDARANRGGQILEAVTKDQLNIGLIGQLRFRIAESNLYAYLFGVKRPVVHTMGYFVSILRQHIANFQAPIHDGSDAQDNAGASGVSINDLRKHLRSINETMDQDCATSAARYGIELDASLITSIDPPAEVESALAAINTAHNHVSSEVSLAQASADQKLVQSKRAVEIETLNAHAEVEPLVQLANQLTELKRAGGAPSIEAYTRNVRLSLYARAKEAIVEVQP